MSRERRPHAANAFEDAVLDAVNRQLISELQGDARLTMAELGRRVGLSAPAVAERVGRLEASGVIVGYSARIDPRALGFALAAVVRVRPAPRQLAKVVEIAKASHEVVECHRITGEDCFLLRVQLRSIDGLEEVLDRFAPFGQTTTSIIQSTPVPPRQLSPAG